MNGQTFRLGNVRVGMIVDLTAAILNSRGKP